MYWTIPHCFIHAEKHPPGLVGLLDVVTYDVKSVACFRNVTPLKMQMLFGIVSVEDVDEKKNC